METCNRRFSFTKSERLKKGDFRSIRWRKVRETEHFILLCNRTDTDRKRIAVTTRKKIGGAVDRNRIRRMVKEFFRLNRQLFYESHDHLVKVKRLPQKKTWKDIKTELENLLI
ncbi:MAG: ribonuclease P protein component [Syntrophorhabdaceae bacterium]|nr:ribonuclease P protein component [Syntrophorhabdaceae bacterium]